MRRGNPISWRRAFWIRGELVDLGLLGVRPRAHFRVRMFRRPKGGIGRRSRRFCLFQNLFPSHHFTGCLPVHILIFHRFNCLRFINDLFNAMVSPSRELTPSVDSMPMFFYN